MARTTVIVVYILFNDFSFKLQPSKGSLKSQYKLRAKLSKKKARSGGLSVRFCFGIWFSLVHESLKSYLGCEW